MSSYRNRRVRAQRKRHSRTVAQLKDRIRTAAEECEVQARSFGRRPPTLYGESCQLTARSCASAILGLIRRSRRQT